MLKGVSGKKQDANLRQTKETPTAQITAQKNA